MSGNNGKVWRRKGEEGKKKGEKDRKHGHIFTNFILAMCGDGVCDRNENCSTCFFDCGACGMISSYYFCHKIIYIPKKKYI
jgi:hypothetical protein